LIGELKRDPALRDKIIPLAFHVDYWNQLGWRDPFSSAEWSQRQIAYARAMNLDGPYTPQAVVDGQRQFVGSDRRSLYDAISRASRDNVTDHIDLKNGVAAGSTSRELDLYAAVVRDETSTAVKAGENSGRTMQNDAVVHKLTRLARAKGEFTQNTNGANVVFLQDPKTLKIFAAATAR
jgi:hypothetical protein